MPDAARLRIGYVLKRFPRLSETFILNEMLALERLGVAVEVFSLLKPPAEPRHGLLAELRAPVTYLPSVGNLGRVRMLEGLAAETTTLARALPADGDFGPLYPAKTAEDVAALHLKAATLAIMARGRGIGHLHAHFGSDATTVALLAGRLAGIGYSFTAHARDIYHTYADPDADDAMRRAKLAEARFVVTVSERNRRRLAELAPAARVQRIYNGIDLARFAPAPERRRAGLIVSVGRLIEKKGFADLVAACAILHEAGTAFRCRIVGTGPLRAELDARIAAAGLAERVDILDPMPQERLVPLMQEASIVTLPCVIAASGDRDGLPTTLLEGMALGLPLVTTTVAGGPEIVEDGRTGHLVAPNDPVALADALTRLLADPTGAKAMGTAGRHRAAELFALDRNAAALARLIAETTRPAATRLEAV